ncbi:N-acetylneuraminate lyase [Elysia marginata]|uniref:N-acetylneuraminate lyase n=1 Tax=Elysia marginata TaxID=1093978 RepID=A0AAV4EEB6_9GAST|nr:N-acetylneuraminate lyase [Elysia marginata]
MSVMVQVGGTSFRDTIDLTRHAVSCGAHVISALAPLYFTPVTVVNMEEFLHKARDKVPNLRGIKFSSKDLYEGARCLRTKDANGHNFDILFGSDESSPFSGSHTRMATTSRRAQHSLCNPENQGDRTLAMVASIDLSNRLAYGTNAASY